MTSIKIYYKLSNYNTVDGITGHESINEIIVDRLLTILGIPHLEYQLIYANVIVDDRIMETYVCASEDFKEKGDSKIALVLMLGKGKCAQDDYYLTPVDENSITSRFCDRFEKKIEDVIPLHNNALLVFFRNGEVKLYDVER